MNKQTRALAETIKTNLKTNPAWVERAILALYAKQTTDEQSALDTRYQNHQGFTSADARRFSFVAQFIQKGGHLTREKALGVYAVRLQKYAGQLATIALAKAAQKAEKAVAAPMALPLPSPTFAAPGRLVGGYRTDGLRFPYGFCQKCGCSENHDGEVCESN